MASRHVAITLDQKVLPCLLVVLTAAHEHMLGARSELERVTAPDHDVRDRIEFPLRAVPVA